MIDGCDYARIHGNVVSGYFQTGDAFDNETATDELLRAYIVGNIFTNDATSSGKAVAMDALATGIMANNLMRTGLDFEAGFTHSPLMGLWANYIWDTSGTSGAIIPTTLSSS